MHTRLLVLLIVSTISISPPHVVVSSSQQEQGTHTNLRLESTSPFSLALETLEKQLRYNFNHFNLLRRAMTHSSYSGENNRALSILGLDVIETSVSLRSLERDIDASPEDVSRKIKEITKVDSCAVDGSKFGLEKIVRVSSKMNSSTPSIVCGAFRAIFGAIALDSGKADDAGDVFWNVTTHRTGGDFAM